MYKTECKEQVWPDGVLRSTVDAAIKKIDLGNSRVSYDSIKNELQTLRQLRHPNIVSLYTAFVLPKTEILWIVMGLAESGSTLDALRWRMKKKMGPYEETTIATILFYTLHGLDYLHKRGMIHRDVKVENIMLDGAGHVKLIDFGLACELRGFEEPVSPTGSLIYMAPEMIRDNMGGRHTDW